MTTSAKTSRLLSEACREAQAAASRLSDLGIVCERDEAIGFQTTAEWLLDQLDQHREELPPATVLVATSEEMKPHVENCLLQVKIIGEKNFQATESRLAPFGQRAYEVLPDLNTFQPSLLNSL